jgi:hypothetical protein
MALFSLDNSMVGTLISGNKLFEILLGLLTGLLENFAPVLLLATYLLLFLVY